MNSPLAPLLARQEILVLDGGLATLLQARGHRLDDALWSARLLADEPAAIEQVHRDYLEAGADCIVTASYQATVEGFVARGHDPDEARMLLQRSIELACRAREGFALSPGRLRPLVAASIGPYGAARADGSEYRGDYDLDEDGLVDFHRERFELLARGGADLLACETIPSALEARALLRLLRAHPGVPAWISFSCRDGRSLADGTDLATIGAEVAAEPTVVAVGVNCVPPHLVEQQLERLSAVTDKPLVAYPNSGESWDGARKRWSGSSDPGRLAVECSRWREKGARLIGGCCRTDPETIRQIRACYLP